MGTGIEALDWIVQFAQNEPQLALIVSLIGVLIVFFLINMIGGDKKE